MNTEASGRRSNRALLIEDDEGVRRSLQLLLHGRGYDVRAYASAGLVLENDEVGEAGLLVTDYRLPDGNGIDLLRSLRRRGWAGRSVLITAYPSASVLQEAFDSGFDAVLEKPLRQRSLIAALAGRP